MGRHYQRGSVLFDLHRYRDAVDAFTEELTEQPQSGVAYAMRAASWLNSGYVRKARRDVYEAIRLAPELGYAYYVLSCIQSRQGNATKAEKSVREALRLETNPTYFYRLAEIHFVRNRFAQCLMFVEEGLAIDPMDANCLVLRAKCLSALGRQHDAKRCLLNILLHNPEDPAAHQTLGQLTLQVGDTAEARDALRKARRLNPIQHNDRDALAAAYGRLLWPLSIVDRRLIRFESWSPNERWRLMAGVSSALVLSVFVPQYVLTVPIFVLLFNAFAASMTIDLLAVPLGKIAFRRDLDVAWYRLVLEPMRLLVAFFLHIVATFAAWLCALEPMIAALLLGFALNFELILTLLRKDRLLAQVFGAVVGFFCVVIPIGLTATFLVEDVTTFGALIMWTFSLLFSYLLTAYWR